MASIYGAIVGGAVSLLPDYLDRLEQPSSPLALVSFWLDHRGSLTAPFPTAAFQALPNDTARYHFLLLDSIFENLGKAQLRVPAFFGKFHRTSDELDPLLAQALTIFWLAEDFQQGWDQCALQYPQSPVLEHPRSGQSPVLEHPRSGQSPVLEHPRSGQSPVLEHPRSGQSPVLEHLRSGQSPVLESRSGGMTSLPEAILELRALYGQLAGGYWGLAGIPDHLLDALLATGFNLAQYLAQHGKI